MSSAAVRRLSASSSRPWRRRTEARFAITCPSCSSSPRSLQEDERLLELLNGQGDAAGLNESKSQVVARQRLGPPVTELVHDLERGQVLLGCLLSIALTSKLRPELVEPARLAVPVGCGWFLPASFDDGPGSLGRDARYAAPVLVEVELTEPRLDRARSPLHRPDGSLYSLSQSVAAHEPAPGRQETSDKHKGKGREQDGAEAESRPAFRPAGTRFR